MPLGPFAPIPPREKIRRSHINDLRTALTGIQDAYDVAVANGFTGTRGQWLDSLKGEKGDPGAGLAPIGSAETVDDLPSGGNTVGDVRTVDADGRAYRWDGSAWIDIGAFRGPPGELVKSVADTYYAAKAATEAALSRAETRVLDIRQFGAIGTTDDVATLQAAITQANGAWISIPPGAVVQSGQVNVTGTARIRLEAGAELRMLPGAHNTPLFEFTGTELTIRGPGRISGNRHNNTGRPSVIRADVPTGKRVDIEGIHFTAFDIALRVDNFGGYVNLSHCTFTDQGQHRGGAGQLTCLLYMVSGEHGATNAQLRTNWNRAYFTDPENFDGSAPGGFFIDSGNKAVWPAEENPFVNWWAIGNDMYRYGQYGNVNSITPFHAYPTVGKAYLMYNLLRECLGGFDIKSGDDVMIAYNQIFSDLVSSKWSTDAGYIHYAPGFHAGTSQHRRAKISHNIVVGTGGTAEQGSYGISIEGFVNEGTPSPARDVEIDHNHVEVRGIPLYANYIESLKSDHNTFRTLPGSSALKRGVNLANISGTVRMTNDVIVSDQQAILCSQTAGQNKDATIILRGVDAESTTSANTVDVRGVAELDIGGPTRLKRAGGGNALVVTADIASPTPNKVKQFRLDGDNLRLIPDGANAATVNLIWANIEAFQGSIPPRATSGRPAATSVAAGTRYYDTTLNKPIWSDGTAWRDAAGTVV